MACSFGNSHERGFIHPYPTTSGTKGFIGNRFAGGNYNRNRFGRTSQSFLVMGKCSLVLKITYTARRWNIMQLLNAKIQRGYFWFPGAMPGLPQSSVSTS